MSFSIGQKTSDILVAIYLIATLFVRFLLEPQLGGNWWISIGLGAMALLLPWALIQSGVLRPGLFQWSGGHRADDK